MSFPKSWPPGCPSADTPDAVGDVFRIVKKTPVNADDFYSHHETGKLPKADPCLRCGLSVFRLLEDALNQQQLLPMLGNRIAKAQLVSAHGKADSTKGQMPTHTTWWPFEGIDRAALFVIILEVA